jgi:hypothetical protein
MRQRDAACSHEDPSLPQDHAASFLQRVVRNELQRGLASEIELIGRRIVAMPIAE